MEVLTFLKTKIWNSKWFAEFKEKELMQVRISAFKDSQKDLLDTMEDDLKKRADILADQKLKALLSLEGIPEVIKTKGNQILINGTPVEDSRLANLRSEAELFSASDLWKVLNDSIAEQAKMAMFVLGEDSKKQLDTGRTILYTLSSQKNAIETLKKLSTPSNQ